MCLACSNECCTNEDIAGCGCLSCDEEYCSTEHKPSDEPEDPDKMTARLIESAYYMEKYYPGFLAKWQENEAKDGAKP